jgi:2-dehydro-3-deoxyphosphogluconate aldolase/(4S)-4-hydroxy-2-oxoglutarate aldolase
MNREQGLAQIEQTQIIAIVRGVAAKDIVKVAEALYEGGVTVMEVTLNTKDAPKMIAQLQQECGDRMFIGAGTVLDTEDARQALEAGASFFVTPHADEDVIRFAVQHELPVFPGAMTPTEVYKAWKAGATAVKVFPSTGLGPSYIKDLRGPLNGIPLVAVGGITASNIAEFMKAGCFAAGISGALVNLEEIRRGNFAWTTEQARTFTSIVAEFRRGQ